MLKSNQKFILSLNLLICDKYWRQATPRHLHHTPPTSHNCFPFHWSPPYLNPVPHTLMTRLSSVLDLTALSFCLLPTLPDPVFFPVNLPAFCLRPWVLVLACHSDPACLLVNLTACCCWRWALAIAPRASRPLRLLGPSVLCSTIKLCLIHWLCCSLFEVWHSLNYDKFSI